MRQSSGTSFDLDSLADPGDGTVVALLRHGRTAWNHERRFLGRTDLPLDEVGSAEAARAGRRLSGRFDRVFCSPLLRARQTAAPIAPEAEIVDGLTEIDVGALDGLYGHEALAQHGAFLELWNTDPTDAPMPGGGESLRQVQARALEALQRIASENAGRRVLCVTHQMVIASLVCHALGLPLTEWRRYRVENTGLDVLSIDAKGIRLLSHGWVAGA